MDAPAAGWYFSKVHPRARSDRSGRPATVAFHRTKYGPELLVDAAYVRQMPAFRQDVARPHVLEFHDILLVTRGRGRFFVDGSAHRVAPGQVIFSRPGEVRRFEVPGLDGACLFFTEEFLAAFFRDARLLEQFAYFRSGRPSPALALSARERRVFLQRFATMQAEIAERQSGAPDALRAVLYEVLVLLGRWYATRHPDSALPPRAGLVHRFEILLERDFAHRHGVAHYARELGVSPGHLSAVCRQDAGRGALARVQARVLLEAKRLLLQGEQTVAEIAFRLGFVDPAYFARFFRRSAGAAPGEWRADRRPGRLPGPRRLS